MANSKRCHSLNGLGSFSGRGGGGGRRGGGGSKSERGGGGGGVVHRSASRTNRPPSETITLNLTERFQGTLKRARVINIRPSVSRET